VILSAADLSAWVGRAAQDPFGRPVGILAEVLRDRETRAPEWLVLAADGDRAGHVVPAAGAAPTGGRLRVAATAELIEGAPTLGLDSDMDTELKQRAAAHYGLRIDRAASSSGRLRGAEQAAAADALPASQGGRTHEPITEARRGEIASCLRRARAMEQASLELLVAMRSRVQDEELVHDVALHRAATNRHAERVRERLDELDASPERLRDWLASLDSKARALLGRLRSVPDAHDVRAAYEFEQREIEIYAHLARLAREAGDHRTAAMCGSIAADELAMAFTLRASRLWADPAARHGERSPFTPPQDLAELAPRT
jgi:ferritin-like metal-binding protein YciE